MTVELGSGRGLENGLSCSSVMGRPDPERIIAGLCIEIDTTTLETTIFHRTLAARLGSGCLCRKDQDAFSLTPTTIEARTEICQHLFETNTYEE